VNDVSVNAQVAQGTPGVNDVGEIESDMDDPGLVTGSLEVGLSTTINMDASDTTMAAIVQTINDAKAGVTATLLNPVDIVLNSANPSLKVQSTIDTQGDDLMFMGGQGNNSFFSTSVVTGSVSDITANPLTYNSNPFYAGTQDVGEIADAGTPGTSAKAASAATLSYSDSAGQSLSATDLLNQADAEAALSGVSTAIVDVAAQDGYVGSQINTLNAVGEVLGTQAQNVQSAQNAVQATDYAAATSAMSKYEILSQTGIAALAQANTLQQEVTKLLQ
jgi:flagellin